jgi:phospholipase/lecithinase/hemolysin
VIFVGGNDARDALVAAQTDEVQAQMIVGAAVTAIADAVQTLWAFGARSFLVMNAAWSGALDTLEAALRNLTINRVDIFDTLNDVVVNPGDFGIEDAENPCLTFGVIGGAVCAWPHRRLFWDGIYPSSGGHRILRDTVVEALTGP